MLSRIRQHFDRFFFESCDPRVASLLRIAYASLLVVYVVVLIPDGTQWFSDVGVLSTSSAGQMTGESHDSLFFYRSSPDVIRICLGVMLVQALLLLVGCWSRLQVACIFFWLVSFQHRNLMITDGEDIVFRWFAFLMIFLPLDHRWSLARVISGRASNATVAAAWGLRLIQIQMAVIYLSSAWCKLLGESWRDGSALYYISRLDDYFGRLPFLAAMFDEPWCFRSLTWGTIIIELLVPILIWFPRLRRPCIIAAAGLHIGIELTMNLFLFQWIMLVGLLSFAKPKTSKSLV